MDKEKKIPIKKPLNEDISSDRRKIAKKKSKPQLEILQKFGDNYSSKIKQEQDKLDEKIKEVQLKIEEQRKIMKKNGLSDRENYEQVSKDVKSLENKLDKQLQKYNQAVAHNRQLRDKIDALRRERVVFDKIYKKLEKELENKKKEMHTIIEEAEDAYKKREKAKADMESLKKEAEQEQQEFQKEWNKLEILIEQDKQVQNFINDKSKKKIENEKEKEVAPEINKKKPQSRKQIEAGTNDRKVNKIIENSHALNKETSSTLEDMMKVQEYENAFNSIKEATQINDIDTLIEQFEKAENNNFSLLKYVESLSADIKELDQEINSVQKEIDKYTTEGGGEFDNNRDKQFQKINEELEKQKRETEEYERQYQETIKTINALKIGIKSIFDRIGCNNEAVQEIIGTHGVTESNMMQYLGIIEQRTNEILQMYSACQVKGPFDSHQPKSSQPIQAQPKEQVDIEPPEGSDVPNLEEKPAENIDFLSPTQLKSKADTFIKENFNKYVKKNQKSKAK